MQAWELTRIAGARAAKNRLYREFLRVPDLVGGRGAITVGDETREVATGSLVFVAATVPHRFHDIVERLEILVVFGPAEGARG